VDARDKRGHDENVRHLLCVGIFLALSIPARPARLNDGG
jgi:hypothetical protein